MSTAPRRFYTVEGDDFNNHMVVRRSRRLAAIVGPGSPAAGAGLVNLRKQGDRRPVWRFGPAALLTD